MIQLIALAIIIAGIYFIIRGFTESSQMSRDAYIFNDKSDEKEGHEGKDRDKYREVEQKVKGGGVILIGPIPIVFGESRYAVLALVLAILLMVLSFIFIFGGEI